MSEINITMESGTSKRLLTAGKYCDRDIVVTATGGGDSGLAAKYAKFSIVPTSTSALIIGNPLGGIARIVSVHKVVPITGTARKVTEYLIDANLGIGTMETASASSIVRYAVTKAEESLANSQFRVSDGQIELRQYSSAVNFVSGAEYEVEIWQ